MLEIVISIIDLEQHINIFVKEFQQFWHAVFFFNFLNIIGGSMALLLYLIIYSRIIRHFLGTCSSSIALFDQ